MTDRVSAQGLLLVDKSAWVRDLSTAPKAFELCMCDITRLEILYSARSFTEYERFEDELDLYRSLTSNAETWAIARSAHRELAKIGQHRVSLPDLLLAACAQQHGAGILHVDRHFDVLEPILSFKGHRLLHSA